MGWPLLPLYSQTLENRIAQTILASLEQPFNTFHFLKDSLYIEYSYGEISSLAYFDQIGTSIS